MDNKIFDTQALKAFKRLIYSAQEIILTCHVRPDGDAMGSTLGLYHMLKAMGKHPTVVTPDQCPKSLSFLPGMKEVVAATKYPDFAREKVNSADLIICCDFNTPSRQDAFAPVLAEAKCPKILIDHHEGPDNFTDVMFSFPKMSSASELVFRLLAAIGLYSEMPLDAATCICTGLITDTRNFSVNCDNPETYEILMRLLEKGVDKPRIVREALECRSYDSLRLQSYALYRKLEIFPRHHAAVITLSLDEQEEFNYERGDSEGLVNVPLQVRGVVYSFFLREEKDMVKVSARSINGFPVNEICSRFFSGGGHIMAAGGEFREGDPADRLERCRQILIDAMPEYDAEVKKTDPEKIQMPVHKNSYSNQ